MTLPGDQPSPRRARIGLVVGPAAFALMLAAGAPASMTSGAWRVAAIALWMAVWWMTEAAPLAATALLPIVLFPLLGVATVASATAPYANPIVFLFLGGFVLALAMERTGLHRRIALAVLAHTGTRPTSLVFGFMVATAFISMWMSNTATALMMLPVASSVLALLDDDAAARGTAADPALAPALYLGVAFAASLGGMATLIGTPPNALLAGTMLETHGVRIGFVQYMALGVPLVAVALPITWLLLTRVTLRVGTTASPGIGVVIAREVAALGRRSRAENRVALVATLVATAWIFQPLIERRVPGANDTTIAVAGALALLVVPLSWRRLDFAITWDVVERLPWGVLLLFGGGLSLAAGIQSTGLAGWIGARLGALDAVPPVVVVLVLAAAVCALSELASNTAIAASFLPIAAALAVAAGRHPLFLALPAALAASCGFMLPVATPPNALAYATGRVSVPQMARAGLWLDVLMIALVAAAMFLLAPLVFPQLR